MQTPSLRQGLFFDFFFALWYYVAMSFNQKEWWNYVGQMENINMIRTHIWTPFGEDGSWIPEEMYEPHFKLLKENISFDKVLDFGCGLGRNYPTLSRVFKEVHGFDTCPMIDQLAAICEKENLNYEQITCEWDAHKENRFDCVFECTVFQHIPVEQVKSRLKDISEMTDYLMGRFRSYNDQDRDFQSETGGHNMMQIVEEVDCFDVVDISIPHSEAISLMNDNHYDVLLKSR